MARLPPVASVVASAAALLAGFAAVLTGTPGIFYALGLAGAREELVRLEVVKPLAISVGSGAQGMVSVNPWFKVIRGPEVNTTAIKVELENIEELEQYFRHLILVIREAVEFTGEGSYTDSQSYNLTQPVYARMVSASGKDKIIADAIRDSVVSQGLPKLGYILLMT